MSYYTIENIEKFIESLKDDLEYWNNVKPTGMISGLSKKLKVKAISNMLQNSEELLIQLKKHK